MNIDVQVHVLGSLNAVAVAPNGVMFGIGTDHFLYAKEGRAPSSPWFCLNDKAALIDLAFGPDGRLFVVGNDKRVYFNTSMRVFDGFWKRLDEEDVSMQYIAFDPAGRMWTARDGNLYIRKLGTQVGAPLGRLTQFTPSLRVYT